MTAGEVAPGSTAQPRSVALSTGYDRVAITALSVWRDSLHSRPEGIRGTGRSEHDTIGPGTKPRPNSPTLGAHRAIVIPRVWLSDCDEVLTDNIGALAY